MPLIVGIIGKIDIIVIVYFGERPVELDSIICFGENFYKLLHKKRL